MFTARDLIVAVSTVTGISIDDLLGKRRFRQLAQARFIGYYAVRKFTQRSLPAIGRIFGRDHTTVLYGLQKMEKHILDNPGSWSSLEQAILHYAELAREQRWAAQAKAAEKFAVKSVDSEVAAAYVQATPGG